MEKLFIHHKDGGQVTISCKNGLAIIYWETKFEHMKNRLKRAYIQRYPKKNNEPIVLVNVKQEADNE